MKVGKRVRGSLYLHRSAVSSLLPDDVSRVNAASDRCDFKWNVLRLSPGGVTLLKYADFEDDPFPALEASLSIRDGEWIPTRRDYSTRSNPPILHRKELLVGPDHPKRTEWAATTERLVACGAFKNAHLIGTRRVWATRLSSLGLAADGGTQ